MSVFYRMKETAAFVVFFLFFDVKEYCFVLRPAFVSPACLSNLLRMNIYVGRLPFYLFMGSRERDLRQQGPDEPPPGGLWLACFHTCGCGVRFVC